MIMWRVSRREGGRQGQQLVRECEVLRPGPTCLVCVRSLLTRRGRFHPERAVDSVVDRPGATFRRSFGGFVVCFR